MFFQKFTRTKLKLIKNLFCLKNSSPLKTKLVSQNLFKANSFQFVNSLLIISLGLVLQRSFLNDYDKVILAKEKEEEEEKDSDAKIHLDLNEIYEKCAVLFLSTKEVNQIYVF